MGSVSIFGILAETLCKQGQQKKGNPEPVNSEPVNGYVFLYKHVGKLSKRKGG